jgi:hydroxyacylglutathione hydrolase
MLKIVTVSGGSLQTCSYAIIDEGKNVVLVDFVPELIEFLKKNNLKVLKLLLTHIHFDHIEGLSDFQKNNDFEFYLSDEALSFLKNPSKDILYFFPPDIIDNIRKMNLKNTIICNENDKISWGEHIIDVIKSPGHSPDCLMFILKENETVFSGDTLFYGSVGRTDLPGGNFNDLKKSINKLFSLVPDDFKVLPGHGPATTVGFEKKNNPYIN